MLAQDVMAVEERPMMAVRMGAIVRDWELLLVGCWLFE